VRLDLGQGGGELLLEEGIELLEVALEGGDLLGGGFDLGLRPISATIGGTAPSYFFIRASSNLRSKFWSRASCRACFNDGEVSAYPLLAQTSIWRWAGILAPRSMRARMARACSSRRPSLSAAKPAAATRASRVGAQVRSMGQSPDGMNARSATRVHRVRGAGG